jgi:hypothetical protein
MPPPSHQFRYPENNHRAGENRSAHKYINQALIHDVGYLSVFTCGIRRRVGNHHPASSLYRKPHDRQSPGLQNHPSYRAKLRPVRAHEIYDGPDYL